ncbi:MAG: low molecular weight phosphatase family protein [Terriglobia bacterium]
MIPSPPEEKLWNILFVCYGNACRSQMAEAFANRLGEGWVKAWSAGSRPFGSIIEETYTVLAEKGISLDEHRSKGLKNVPLAAMDLVVTMGCEVACLLPKDFKGRLVEWEIADPYGMGLDFFRRVRDHIEADVQTLLASLKREDDAGLAERSRQA